MISKQKSNGASPMPRSVSRLRLLLLALVVATAALAVPSGAAASADRTCGVLPGDGAYSYVKVWNTTCSKGEKVASKATRKFCNRRNHGCANPTASRIFKGRVRAKGYRCKLKLRWEFFRVRCTSGNKRILRKGES